ncbi:MAG: bifunctional DNA-formamidopyrimidine glycosylase/DNA-(apurinic or apyrimidinic site) lyase [Desulfurivibrionaceae bacterium]|jgi:formamidopyrimidine-DNA glycosylase|nr:bifunctional DNA-formamidopyrimidine glycosylase/DNA-(apurinic or apyrimidinic site) lyase [Pseudomonadota bacterium]MCG2823272.1 bifunctional DNA-formamidopyrimidine glycosylase/DNA-(apurinic or apyrimidinic site) lyase [Desulfobulbaceae bacterium]MDP2001357.1 bifunctional DNA-formamidopyrimidine glycosylase/DNA-(apurinic or apyrimidinic site) lyase [Desulfurivibrionaceae bacterium]MDP2758595.1 bifunctional DNA-formamidopyrimidine glycosylase/DNA-(apurinic or apyrimidinic site) lyase [Desulf
MPELPEVEVVCQGLGPLVRKRKILSVSFSNKRLRKPFPRAKMYSRVEGSFILGVERRAKYIMLRLTGRSVMLFHLGMTGKIGIFDCDVPRRKHDHLRFVLDNGKEMRFNDVRRFGCVEVYSEKELRENDPFAGLGVEPFSGDFSADYLLDKARGKRVPVKSFLMDNRVVVGLGNIYANETLFAACTHPQTPVNRLSKLDWQLIVTKSRLILKKAIAMGGSTISDYENVSGEAGYFQLELAVYGRQGRPCPRCGQPVVRSVLGGRATFCCPLCQK